MTAFSRKSTNEINWDGSANLTVDSPYIDVINLTGDPGNTTGASTELFLPQTQSSNDEDNLLHGDTLFIKDPNGYLTSTNLLTISQNPNDTGMNLNGKGTRVTVYTTTNILNITFLGGVFFTLADPGLAPTGGPQGTQGSQGATGSKGTQGLLGTQGTQGVLGNKGSQGATGDKGSQGATGDKGSQGATGDKGSQGATGNKGSQGATGDKGTQGTQGITGNKGSQGATGDKGTQGVPGDKGSQGATGFTKVTQGLLCTQEYTRVY